MAKSSLMVTNSKAGARGATISRWRPWMPWIAVVSVLTFLLLPPLVSLVVGSVQVGGLVGEATWTLDNFRYIFDAVSRGGTVGPAVNSALFAIGSGLLALTLGGLLAFIVERTDSPFRTLGYVTAAIIIATPAVVHAIAWSLFLGTNGIVEVLLERVSLWLGITIPTPSIHTLWGMIFVQGTHYSPLAFLLLLGPMRAIDHQIEEAALMSGASPYQTIRHISGPLLLPSLLAVLFLTGIRSLEAFAVPAVIGLPGKVRVLTTDLYLSTRRMPPDLGVANAYALLLIILVLGFLWIYISVSANASKFQTVGGQGHRPLMVRLARKKVLSVGVLFGYFIFLIVGPLVVLIWASLQEYYVGPRAQSLTFDHYINLGDYPGIVDSFKNSILTGAGAATAIMAISLAASWVALRKSSHRQRQTIDLLGSFALVLPGIVVGLALLQLYSWAPVPLYGTIAILVLAYTTRFMPWGLRFTDPGIMSINPELEEAGLMSGATRLQVTRRIVLPLIGLHVLAGWTYLFVIAARELEASVMLVTPRMPVVAPLLYQVWESGRISEVAAFSVSVLVIFGALGMFVHAFVRRRTGSVAG